MTRDLTRLATLVVELGAFVFILGIPDGALGVLWPDMRHSFGLPLDALGLVTIAGTVLYFSGGLVGHRVAERLGPGWTMVASCTVALAGVIAWAAAPDFPTALSGVATLGLARGVIDAVVNAEAALHGGLRRLGILHASWAIGGTLGPILVAAVVAGAGDWRLALVVVSAGIVLLLPVAIAAARSSAGGAGDSRLPGSPVPAVGGTAEATAAGDPVAPAPGAPRRGVFALTVVVFGVYTAAEAGPIAWGYTYLILDRRLSHLLAAVAMAGFWAALTLGRLGVAALGSDGAGTAILECSCLLLVAGTGMFWLLPGGFSVAGLPVAGLGSAAIFPVLVGLTPVRIGTAGTGRAVGASIAAAALGGPLAVALLGLAAARFGVGALGPCLFGATVVLYFANRLLTFTSPRVAEWRGRKW